MSDKKYRDDLDKRIHTITPTSGVRVDTTRFSPSEMNIHEVSTYFDTDTETGLDKAKTQRLRKQYGRNKLEKDFTKGFIDIMKEQTHGLINIMLFAVCILMYIFDRDTAYIICAAFVFAVTVVNAVVERISYMTFSRAKKVTALKVTVRRDGKMYSIDSESLVPGDIIYVRSGSIVGADARLFEANELYVMETTLNGETTAVRKDPMHISFGNDGSSQPNMIYGNTIVKSGSGYGIVCYTGAETMYYSATTKKEASPELIKYAHSFSRILTLISIGVCILTLLFGLIRGMSITTVFACALAVCFSSLYDSVYSLAVASLGNSVKKMGQAGAAPQDLSSFTRLAAIDTIFCDKSTAFPIDETKLNAVFVNDQVFDPMNTLPANRQAVERLLQLYLVCSDMKRELPDNSSDSKSVFTGRQTTTAVIEVCQKLGISIDSLEREYYKTEIERTRDGDCSRVMVMRRNEKLLISKGNPEYILRICSAYIDGGSVKKLDEQTRIKLLQAVKAFGSSRQVVAVSFGVTYADRISDPTSDKQMIFCGFVGFFTSIALNSATAVYTSLKSGITPVMFSNDTFSSAYKFAYDIGVVKNETEVFNADTLNYMNRNAYVQNSPYYKLYLRMSPSQRTDAMMIRRDSGKNVAVTAKSTDELQLINKADASFASETESEELVRQLSDVVLTKGGFITMLNVIKIAKSACERIYALCNYLFMSYCTMAITSLLVILALGYSPFRIQDTALGGVAVNFTFALSVVFAGINKDILAKKTKIYGTEISFKRFIIPLVHSVSNALCVLITCALVDYMYIPDYYPESVVIHTMALVTLSVTMFIQSLSAFGTEFAYKKGIHTKKTVFVSLAFVIAILSALMYCTPISKALGYAPLNAGAVLIAISFPLAKFIIFGLVVNKGKRIKGE